MPSTPAGAGYRACARLTRRSARNFYVAFTPLPGDRRRAMYVLYAFCRVCDDIADAPGPSIAERRSALTTLRARLAEAAEGRGRGLLFATLGDVIDRFGVRPGDLEAIVDGVTMDLAPRRFADLDALRGYCYRVASAVGLATIEILGHRGGRAREHAEAMGIGMQLVNILRDVAEDAREGRLYLPLDALARHGCDPERLLVGAPDGDVRGLFAELAGAARRFHDEGQRLLPLLRRSSRPCPAALAGLYQAILQRIEGADYTVVLERRVRLSTPAKLGVALGCWLRHGLLGDAR